MSWLFCNRRANTRINTLHEQALRLVYDDYETSFSDLLAKDGSLNVHHTNIQTLLPEMCKIKHNLSASSLKDLFSAINDKTVVLQSSFRIPGIKTVFIVPTQLVILDQLYGVVFKMI